MNFENQNVTRKVDTLGRVSIPKGIRDRLNIKANDEVEFWILDTGTKYVCFTNEPRVEDRCGQALQMLEGLGITLAELNDYVNG